MSWNIIKGRDTIVKCKYVGKITRNNLTVGLQDTKLLNEHIEMKVNSTTYCY